MGQAAYVRAYYHCGKHGWFPTDEEFGIETKQTPGAREVIALAGTLEAFDTAAESALERMSGLRVSASMVRRTTEAVGEDVARRRAAGDVFGPEAQWNWHIDATGQRVAYASLDATAVRQQGPRAEKAEGRMPWVGSVFNPPPRGAVRKRRGRRVRETRYVSGLMSLPEIGAQLRRECRAVGVAQADVVVALTDGGNGLEDCLLDALGGIARNIVFILDFWHAAEHLREFAKVLIPHDEPRRKQRCEQWSHRLKHSGGEAMLQELQELDLSQSSAAVREAHREVTGYLRSNLHRTDYPSYLANGWQIGSGMIESACKTVVGQRLKEAGMRWRERGTTALCQIRALHKSQRQLWHDYWKRSAA